MWGGAGIKFNGLYWQGSWRLSVGPKTPALSKNEEGCGAPQTSSLIIFQLSLLPRDKIQTHCMKHEVSVGPLLVKLNITLLNPVAIDIIGVYQL